MKLTLRPEWRLRALSSLLGFIELKVGVRIVLLFAVFNKVAGVYGLIALLTGSGGSLAQFSMYLYSVGGLVAYAWGFKGVNEEDPRKSMLTAHFFLIDHFLNTIWLAIFAVDWWIFNPHDGARSANSPAQQDIIDVGPGRATPMTPEERTAAAQLIWNKEKGTATLLLLAGWICKFYFAALIYSYAIHLQRGTYKSLPLTVTAAHEMEDEYSYHPLYENDLDDEYTNGLGERKPNERQNNRDIDFDVEFDEFEAAGDLERGRVRGRRGDPSMSIGSQSEVGATRSAPKMANGTAVPLQASKHQRIPSKPTPGPTRSIPKSSQAGGSTSPDKGKSRAILQELERGDAPQKWDDDDDDAATSKSGSKSNPSTAATSPRSKP